MRLDFESSTLLCLRLPLSPAYLSESASVHTECCLANLAVWLCVSKCLSLAKAFALSFIGHESVMCGRTEGYIPGLFNRILQMTKSLIPIYPDGPRQQTAL